MGLEEKNGDAAMDAALEAARKRLREGDADSSHAAIVADLRAEQSFDQQLSRVLCEVRDMLLAKNRAYGNSALDPVRIFSRADAVEQLRVRIDDKLSRLMRGHIASGRLAEGVSDAISQEDTVDDLLGYLVLLKIAGRK